MWTCPGFLTRLSESTSRFPLEFFAGLMRKLRKPALLGLGISHNLF